MNKVELSAITRLMHISPAIFQSPRRSHGSSHRHRDNSKAFSSLSQDKDAEIHELSPPPPPPSLPSPQPVPPSNLYTPLVDAVLQRGLSTQEAPFHVPGHKRGTAVPPSLKTILGPAMQYDLTELDGLDYLSYPEGPILKAQQLAAEAWGAGQTWFLVNGTTVGIHAAIMATCSSSCTKGTVILARNSHQSAFNAAVLAGCHVEYAMPCNACGLAHHVTPEALEETFQRAKARGLHVKAAFVVSPTYFGVVSDIEGLVNVCHRHGAVLIVDEAHGAHLHFLPHLEEKNCTNDRTHSTVRNIASKSALDLGADVVIQSTHKLLGALTQGAMLHLSSASPSSFSSSSFLEDLPAKISRALSILQTSSPNYLIMASLDAARAQVQDPQLVAVPHAAAAAIHAWFLNYEDNLRTKENSSKDSAVELTLLTTDVLDYPGETPSMDPWRFTVLIKNIKSKNSSSDTDNSFSLITGWEVAAALERECGVVAELATKNAVVFAVGIGTTMHHAEALIAGLEWLTHSNWQKLTPGKEEKEKKEAGNVGENTQMSVKTPESIKNSNSELNLLPEVVLTPREALSAATEVVPWAAAAGKISAELLCPYPPGVPAVYPGERIDKEMLDMLLDVVRKGGKVVGATDGSLKTLRVVKS